jgi:hypothetical protein
MIHVFLISPFVQDEIHIQEHQPRRIKMAIDMEKLNAFVGQFVGDLGAAVHSGMVVIGESWGYTRLLPKAPWIQASWPLRQAQMSVMCANG